MSDDAGPYSATAMDEQVHIQKLEVLAAHQDRFQLENFYKALQRGGNKRSKLPFFRGGKGGGSVADGEFTVDDMLLYSPDPIPTSLLKLSTDYANRSIKMFMSMLKYMGLGKEYLTDQQKVDIAQKLLHQGLKRPELKDELYMQLIKQTRGNPSLDDKLRAWELFHLVTSTMPPSKEFVALVTEHVHFASHGDMEEQIVREVAMRSWTAMKRSLVAGARKTLPTAEEIQCLLSGKTMTCIVFFLDETFEEISIDLTTTVAEAMKQLADIIKLQNYSTFTLFECRKPVGPRITDDAVDEHIMLDDHKYIADVLFDMKNSKNSREGIQSKLLVKKRMFRETDEAITEPQFINLSYIQAQYDYLLGNFPFVQEDTAQLCALQIQAEYGTSIVNNEEELSAAVVKYIPKQSAASRTHEEWLHDVRSRYRSLDQFSKEEARLHFLRILRSLPYGNSIFFPVKKMEDPIGLLPVKLILGINRRGVHFFKPSPKEYLHSAELRDIMQFGSSSQAVFFKMRVSGVLHIFQFETRQGEDICLALQTHINDIMMKRWNKSMPNAVQAKESQPAGDSGASDSRARETRSGPKYEKHANQMQKTLEEKARMIEELQKREEELRQEKERVAEELIEARDKLKVEEEQIAELHGTKKKLEADKESLLVQIKEAKAAVGEAEANKAAAVVAAREAVDAQMVQELEGKIHEATEELQKVQDRVQGLEKEYKDAVNDKELLEKKLQRLEKSRDNETKELREKLATAKASVGGQVKEKEDSISELMTELAKTTELYNANKLELEQIKTDLNELEDLREMKLDVERKEKMQKKIIADQTKRLEELEKLHKEEQMLRKKYLSMMEDMQGKVRVYVRLARQPAERESVIDVVDEYTVAKKQADRYAVREEFAFDQAYGPDQDNAAAFQTIKGVTGRCIEGFNVCVVAYGLAGSGKSHTMFGNGSDTGIIALAVDDLFATFKKRAKKWDSDMKMSMLVLKGDELTDLLATSKKKLVVKKDVKGLVHVVNAATMVVSSTDLLKETLQKGLKKRDELGIDASSSHVLVRVDIVCSNKDTGVINNGRMIFTDMVGCNKGNAEVGTVNSVVKALEAEQQEIPYTSSTLSKLLSDCMGGNAKTLVIVHGKPEESLWEDTKKTLELGLAIRKVKNDIEKSEINKDILKLKKQLDALKERAGIPKELLDAVDMVDIIDQKAAPSDTAQAAA